MSYFDKNDNKVFKSKIGAFVLKHCFKLSEDNPKTANLPVLVQFLFIIESLLICYFLIVVVAYNLPKNRFPSTHGNRPIKSGILLPTKSDRSRLIPHISGQNQEDILCRVFVSVQDYTIFFPREGK